VVAGEWLIDIARKQWLKILAKERNALLILSETVELQFVDSS